MPGLNPEPQKQNQNVRLASLQYIGANSYLEQQKSTNYNGTTSTRAKYGWYPRVGPCELHAACCIAAAAGAAALQ